MTVIPLAHEAQQKLIGQKTGLPNAYATAIVGRFKEVIEIRRVLFNSFKASLDTIK